MTLQSQYVPTHSPGTDRTHTRLTSTTRPHHTASGPKTSTLATEDVRIRRVCIRLHWTMIFTDYIILASSVLYTWRASLIFSTIPFCVPSWP
jgi:hypothetical protein